MRLLVTGGSGFIGTNLIEQWNRGSIQILNFDIAPPLAPAHRSLWTPGDVLDSQSIKNAFADFAPTHVIHLAARTDCVETTTVEAGYRVNTEGTRNVIAAIAGSPTVDRVIMTSTQYVCGPQHAPSGDQDYAPHTVYGQSKVMAEQITREADLPCTWTLVRPVNIWGPWHLRYTREVWKVLGRRWYLHPGRTPVVRTYGYVGNVVWQMAKIFDAPRERVHRRTLYLGDPPIDIYDWVNGFSQQLVGKPVRVVPRVIVRSLAFIGDALSLVGARFPITSSRFASMTQDYLTPVDQTIALLGEPPFDLERAIAETVRWMREWTQRGGATRAPRQSDGRPVN